MNKDQRNDSNNQVDNGGNQKGLPGSKGNTMTAPLDHSQGGMSGSQQMGNQPATIGGAQNGLRGVAGGMENARGQGQGSAQGGNSGASQGGMPGGASTQRDDVAGRESNDAAGGYPRSPGGANQLAGDQKMDDDTGLSNTANRQSAEIDQGSRQSQQSNVGRRDDGTPD